MKGKSKKAKKLILAEIEKGNGLHFIKEKFGYSTLGRLLDAMRQYGIDSKPLFQQLDKKNKSIDKGIRDQFKNPILKVDISSGKAVNRLGDYWENTSVRVLEECK